MVVLSNQRLGPAVEVMMSREVGSALFIEVARAARPVANAHWERELVRWLDQQAARIAAIAVPAIVIDVAEIAFTPMHFERQRGFLLDVIARAVIESDHARVLVAWAHQIEAHPRESVQVGRRWVWPSAV